MRKKKGCDSLAALEESTICAIGAERYFAAEGTTLIVST